MLGNAAVIIDVDREDEILDCVDAFEHAGIKPILFGADRAVRVADKIRGRVAGVLPSPRIVGTEPREGLASRRNRYSELESAGIRIAFHSDAEEGTVELPLMVAYAVSEGLGLDIAMRALTADAADMLAISDRVGRLAVGLDGDVLLLDGPPLDPTTSVLRVWVNGEEVR
jgi:imidazolonepropionase-like amidohydrolase